MRSQKTPESSFSPLPCQGADAGALHEVPYVVMGDPDEAKHLIFEAAPYFTPISKPHYQLRLAAHQEKLGDDFCVVGVEAFSSRAHTFASSELKKLKQGDFSPLSERQLRVVEAVAPSEEQTISVGGYSLGADVSIQTAHDTTSDDNRGIIKLTGLKAFEPVRVANRGLRKTAKAFSGSGDDFYQNVRASESEQLLEAFGIDSSEDPEKAKKRFDRRTAVGIVGYLASAPFANIALMHGLGTDESISQLNNVLASGEVDTVLAGTSHRSTVSSGFVHGLINTWKWHYPHKFDRYKSEIIEGDHSADDNIRESAQRQAQFGEMILAATE